jgi:quercetin dioxygenase-like cupin family protein/SAM-dependent methyltransferase
MAFVDRRADRMPGEDLKVVTMPGHWVLARLGKRVLRPGGLAMTEALLAGLAIGPSDDVVELAPGLGLTARRILDRKPRSYTGVERDPEAAAYARLHLGPAATLRVGSAESTGLPDGCASVVIGEAMLSMAPPAHKQAIMAEAFRLLRPGGRYAIHELSIVSDVVPPALKKEIEDVLSAAIHVDARPQTGAEWRALLEQVGFSIKAVGHAPMGLLDPARIIADEGFWRALRFFKNVLTDTDARRRVLAMRHAFQQFRSQLGAMSIVVHKPSLAFKAATRRGPVMNEMLAPRPVALDSLVSYEPGSIVSNAVHKDAVGTIMALAFDAGQSRSEHTAPFEAFIQVLDGEAEVRIGSVPHTVAAGQLLRLPANVPHALRAVQRFKALATMLRGPQA